MTERIWDISQRLSACTPLWPGEPDLVLKRNVSIGPDCPVNIGEISFPLHAGKTHPLPKTNNLSGGAGINV